MRNTRKIKIIAILDNKINAGGGFNQAINAILQMQKLCKGRYDFEVFTIFESNLPHLRKLNLNAIVYSYSFIDKLLSIFSVNGLWQVIQERIKIIGPLEKKLIKHGCDLVYFITPGGHSASLQKLNYVLTVWDLSHRDSPEFPEVHSFNTYLNRDLFYRTSLVSAFAVLTDSKRLSELASFRYGVDLDRFIAMPFAPSPFLSINHVLKKEDVLKKYNINEGYFFYPAQLWPHKNHIRILEAVLLLKNIGRHVSVVFSGKDYGNQAYLERYVCDNCLNDQVKFLGFVPVEDMRGLYESTIAIVMPTYFGQTNLPPLEAWLMGKPLIYSSYYSEQSGDAALHIDPDNVNELAEAMIKCFDPKITHELIEAGYKRLKLIEEEYMNSEKKLLEKLNQYSVRRRCWK